MTMQNTVGNSKTGLDSALACIKRGWHVFPCKPRTKHPATLNGFKNATVDETKVRSWWERWPDANVAIATGASGLTVLDVDGGIANADDLDAFRAAHDLSDTYIVRTGRRPEFGAQMYFTGGALRSIPWVDGAVKGDVRSATGYVMAEGCTHPSGAGYERILGAPTALAAVPAYVRNLRPERGFGAVDDGSPITESRNNALTSIAGKMRHAGVPAELLEANLLAVNDARCVPPLPEEEVQRIAENASKWEPAKSAPAVVIGNRASESPAEPVDWRSLFHTRQETDECPDPKFLIDGFLQEESVTGLIGPARARKSIVVLNIIRALLTGEKLFGHFEVPNRPEKVVYLCPESGVRSLSRRIRNLGIASYVGESFFYTSMNSEPVDLDAPALLEAVQGSVLVIDTMVRFFTGEENASGDMSAFGRKCHTLVRHGVQAIILLHHTAKAAETITLESGRGSGDFGGALTCCWSTTLDDFEQAYTSQSLLSCVKQRDFRAESFKVSPSGDENNFLLQYVEGSENARVTVGAKEKPGKAKAMVFIRANPGMTAEATRQALEKQGIRYGVSAIGNMIREAKALTVSEA